MEHFYQNIHGWFSYEYIYKNIVEQAAEEAAAHGIVAESNEIHTFIQIPE